MSEGATMLIGLEDPGTRALGRALGAEVAQVPSTLVPGDDREQWKRRLDLWATEFEGPPSTHRVVVCTWGPRRPARPLLGVSADEWEAAVEDPLALWFAALRLAAAGCANGGSVVVVIERPAALDSWGRALEVAVGEGLVALARSVAHSEGRRDVRVNAVITEVWTAPRGSPLLGLPPMLRAFPGRPEIEVAGAVNMLLSDDSTGVSGLVVRADCGRSWS